MFKSLDINHLDTILHANYEVTVILGKEKKRKSFGE